MTLDVDIRRRASFAGGQSFGQAGAYERIDARVTVAVNPDAAAQQGVFDIAYAPRGADGLVRVTTDVFILKPVSLAQGSGTLFVELPNRGNKRCLQFFNDAVASNDPWSAHEAGNGFLMHRGDTVVCVAWQGDVLRGDGRMLVDVPVANHRGQPITATIRAEFIVDVSGVRSLPLSGKNGTRSHPSVTLDTAGAELRRRRYPDTAAEIIPSSNWEFARLEGGGRGGAGDISGGEQAIIPSDSHIFLPAGFEPGWIYELLYTARDPLVLDLGFVAVRDLISFLRYDDTDANPLKGSKPRVIGWGRSQSGRAIRDFVYRGFNADAAGRRVFDGFLSHIAGAGRTTMNRFSNLVVAASRPYEDWIFPSDRFPFSYATSVDHVTGIEDGLLKRPDTDPRIIHTQTASEYWSRRGSLVHTDTRGQDLEQPATVRIYFWSSSQHWSDPVASLPPKGVCTQYQNIVATSAFFRATLVLMDDWLRDGTAPPPSRIPRRADGSLVEMAAWRAQFPSIPGVACPAKPNALPAIDYGAAFAGGGAALAEPVADTGRAYAVLVPQVDDDGNDVAGVRAPMVSAPLGTYTGWNLRIAGHGGGALHDFSGSYIPLAETPEERQASGDPRLSVIERYPTQDAYVEAIRDAAAALAQDRFLLDDDIDNAARAAASWGRPRHVVSLSLGVAKNRAASTPKSRMP